MEPKPEIFSEDEWSEIIRTLALSKREGQIIRGLFMDCPDKRIAMDLKISVSTVRTHIGRLFRKLNADGRHDVILHVFKSFRDSSSGVNCPQGCRRQK